MVVSNLGARCRINLGKTICNGPMDSRGNGVPSVLRATQRSSQASGWLTGSIHCSFRLERCLAGSNVDIVDEHYLIHFDKLV